MIKAAIVGLGRWGQTLVSSVQNKSDAIRFVAGVARTPVKAHAFAQSNNIPLLQDFAQVLSDPNVGAIVLATPHSQHEGQIIEAAKAGKHIYVEKPMTLDKMSAMRAADAVKAAGVILAVGHQRRFHPAMNALRNILKADSIGLPLHAECSFCAPSALMTPVTHWRGTAAEVPLGGMTTMGIHMIDSVIDLFGKVAEVYALSRKSVGIAETDDTTSVLMRLENGMTAYLGMVAATALTYRFQVFGSKAKAEIRGFTLDHFELVPVKGDPMFNDYPAFDMERAALEDFANAIERKRPFAIPVEDMVHATAVMEACIHSVATRHPETLV